MFIIHHNKIIKTRKNYEKFVLLVSLLIKRNLTPTYYYSNFHFPEFPNNYFAVEAFHLIRIRTAEYIISVENTGRLEELSRWYEHIYDRDEIIKNIIIEIVLLMNPSYYYNKENDILDIKMEDKLLIMKRETD